MIDLETICPYTGLRSFSEDESLYFKGRDHQIIKVIEQLEQKKFLMVTGASGDGKSSLIFAGLIPQARAGFFKATYSNWQIISFRPERSPLSNMAKALAATLHLEAVSIENELNHGFSSLTEIYKSSSLYIDHQDPSWREANADKKLEWDRQAGNLLIVVDQFEEFFTNPENFPNGVPSQDARLVLNILLETVKIALRDGLPIYIVFTMRSDYIGQCAAFRGLPEFIGFSQFFVPRLQRKELQQVIEEPAVLSGNRISKRLVDRLIYDLEDTEDHLPILQHVLKEIWKTADHGADEMDLIHYAMVGGMPGDKLPKEDVERFRLWEENLPAHQRHYLQTPGLSNVLDIHATRLYMEAATAFNRAHTQNISEKEAKLIIGITFACLTRIDENRAVRNRMTLEEITNIINVPTITSKIVDDVLRPFRNPEHTLVRPFMDEHSSGGELPPNTVLDITHEALIRNWKLLNRWAAKEFEYYNTFIDFKKQLRRWLENGKSGDYLLPIGPLTYFETWFKNCRPNAYWINRYNPDAGEPIEKIRQSQLVLNYSRQFLRKSALKLLITRAFMRYGARRISTAVILVAVLIGSGFLIYSRWTKKNDVVLGSIVSEGAQLLLAPEADPISKSEFILDAERLHPGFFIKTVKGLPDKEKQIGIALLIPELIFSRNKYCNAPLVMSSFQLADSLISNEPDPDFNQTKAVDDYLNHRNDLLNIELNHLYFNSNPGLKGRQDLHAKQLGKFIFGFLKTVDPSLKYDKKAIYIATAHTLNFHALSSDSLASLISFLSPFEANQPVRKKFGLLFPSNETISVGNNKVIEHNGGYELLANLYASVGQSRLAMMCMDTILKYHKDYDLNLNNSRNVAGYFLMYDHNIAFKEFVTEYAKRLGLSRYEYLRGFVNRAGIFDALQAVRAINHGNANPNLALLSVKSLDNIFEIYRNTVQEDIKDPNERNFALALLSKHQASLLAKKFREKREAADSSRITLLFDEAFAFYQKLPEPFLETEIELILMADVDAFSTPLHRKRKQLFIYPDHLNLVLSNFSSGGGLFYGDAFFNYLKRTNRLTSLYRSQDDFSFLNRWVSTSFLYRDLIFPLTPFNGSYANCVSLDHSVLVLLDSLITHSGFEKQLDNSWIQIQLIRDFLAQKNGAKAILIWDRVNWDKLITGNRNFFETISLRNYATRAAKEMISAGYLSRVSPFVHRFKRQGNRIAAFAQLGIASYENGLQPRAEAYLDSISQEFANTGSINESSYGFFYDLRNGAVQLTALLKQEGGNREILDLTGSMGANTIEGIANWTRAYASLGKYYQAKSVIPNLANADDRLYLYSTILYTEIMKTRGSERDPWTDYDREYKNFLNFTIYYFDLI